MAQILHGRIQLNQEESENFLRMFYHPDLEMLRRRDAWLESPNENISIIKDDEEIVTTIVIND